MRILSVLLLTGLIASCGMVDTITKTKPVRQDIAVSYRGPSADGHDIRRVVVIPFQDRSTGAATEMIHDVFVSEFQKRHQVEVIGLGSEALTDSEERAFYATGTVRQETVVRMIQQYNADAVVYGVITRWRAYTPPALSIRVTMVSGGAGDVVWEAHGVFDTSEKRVQQDIHHYHDTVLAKSDNLEQWHRVKQSPWMFSAYCCARLASTF